MTYEMKMEKELEDVSEGYFGAMAIAKEADKEVWALRAALQEVLDYEDVQPAYFIKVKKLLELK